MAQSVTVEQTHPVIAELVDKGLSIGSRLEVTLREGTTWDNGWSPAPACDPKGFRLPYDWEAQEGCENYGGNLVSGFVANIEDTRITLVPHMHVDSDGNLRPVYNHGNNFVAADVIKSYVLNK